MIHCWILTQLEVEGREGEGRWRGGEAEGRGGGMERRGGEAEGR